MLTIPSIITTPDHEHVIIAHCTPVGKGAIALIRLSGSNTIPIVDHIARLTSQKKLCEAISHTIHHGIIVNNANEIVDQVLFLVMKGPKTFTGQDCIEITCHNNPFIIEEIISLAIANGARLAQPGEFAQRAVLNNKIDLLQAEAIHDLVHANSTIALKRSLGQLQGTLSAWMIELEKLLLKIMSLCEVTFEFVDEDMGFDSEIRSLLNEAITMITQTCQSFNQQKHIREGVRIALIGSVNTGKSSLFNALLEKNRAIVADLAGTTRDVIEAGCYHNGVYWTLIDTAGIRETDNIVERLGIEKSFEQAHLADIILLVFDGARPLTIAEKEIYHALQEQYDNKIILVCNKIDLKESILIPNSHPISVTTGTGITLLRQLLETKINTLLNAGDSPFMLNKRQYTHLVAMHEHLTTLIALTQGTIEYEIISYYIRILLVDLAQCVGRTINEQCLDSIFRDFCIGK